MKTIIYLFLLFGTYNLLAQQTQIRVPIANGNDDIEKSTDFYPASSDLELGGFDSYNGGVQYVALRFSNIALPPNAQISKAYIQFTVKDVNTGTASVSIKCQNGNAAAYLSTENILQRNYVTPVVTWNPPAWTVAGASGLNQQTANLSAQIQSAIATGWVSGNALSFVLQGNATVDNILNARSYENNATHAGAPELVIEYTTGINPCSPDVLPPTITNCPANISLTTTGTTAVATWTVPTITDNCSPNITPSVISSPTAGLTQGSAFPIGTTTVTYSAKDAANNNALPCIFTVTVSGSSATTLRVPIIESNDDVEVTTSINTTSSDLELGGFDSFNGGVQYVALRFSNIALPPNAQISKAYIQFTAKDVNTGTASVSIKCQNGNAGAYLSTENILQRNYVTPIVTWNPPAWTVAGANGLNQQTANLSAQIQSAIATGWVSGNALSFVLQGNATVDNILNARSYDNNATHAGAPELVIEYTTGVNPCSPDILPPTITNCPANISLTTTGTTAVATWTVPTITDNCSPNITPSVISSPTAGLTQGSAFPIGTTTVTYNAKDASNNNATACVFTVTVSGSSSSTILRVPVAESNDDVEISTNFSATSSDLELGGFDTYNSGAQYVAIRFQNITLPPNAQISKAYIQFTAKDANIGTASVSIKCQNGNAGAYLSTENILQRNYVTPIVTWNPPAWTVAGASGLNQQTANLSAQIQAAIATGWVLGNALSFVLQGNATVDNILNARSYEHNATHAGAPELVIEYTTGATSPGILFINEVAPQGTVAISSDWIELYNDATTTASLNDVYITNKAGTPFKFSLTGLTIPAKGFLVLLADNEPSLGNTHLNFKVSASGEKLYLNRNVNGTAVQLSFFESPASLFDEDNVTFGVTTEGTAPPPPAALTKFLGGTPEASNAGGIRYIKANNSLPRGILLTSATATLTAPAGATIRYTTDHSMPSRSNGTIYTQPINITTTTVLKVIAYTVNSETKVEAYSYILPVKGAELLYPNLVTATEYENGMKQLPIVSISTNLFTPTDSISERMASFEYINKFGENASVAAICGVSSYGNSSLTLPKKNFRFHFKNEYGYGNLEYPIFKKDDVDTYTPTTKFDVLDLKIGQDGPSAQGYGMTMTSQGLVSKTMRELGNIDLHTQYTHVFVNGKYNGVYTLKESFNEHFGETYFGGDKDLYDSIESDWDEGSINYNADSIPQGNLVNWNAMRTAAQSNNFQLVKNYLNVSQYIDMLITIMYFDMEWEFRAIADQALVATKFVVENHDPDGALTKTIEADEFTYDLKWTDPSYSEVFEGPGGVFGHLYQGGNKEFKTLVRDRVYEAFQRDSSALTVGRLTTKLNELKSFIKPVFNMELARFNRTFYNDNPYFDEEFNANIEHLPIRFQYNLDKWLEKGLKHTLLPVTFNQPSGTVTTPVLATNPNPNGVIYYTLDGSDPMGNDGIIRPTAKLYTNHLTLNAGVNNVVARVYFNTEFGPKTKATYTSLVAVPSAQAAQILSVNGRLDGQKAVVSWITKTTELVDYFKIEKQNARGEYTLLQTVNAQYSSNRDGIELYNIVDEKLVEGNNIYRIVLFTDVLRAPQYSDLVNVKFMPAEIYALYPNPTSDYFDIDLMTDEGKTVSISIFNSIGTVVLHEKIEKAASSKRINIENLGTGQYSVVIQAEEKKVVKKKISIVR